VQDGRPYIEKINWPFLSEHHGQPSGVKCRPHAPARLQAWPRLQMITPVCAEPTRSRLRFPASRLRPRSDCELHPNGPSGFFNTAVSPPWHRHFERPIRLGRRAAGAASGDYTFQYTYTIGEDGKLSITMVPGTFKGTFLTGPRTGRTEVHDVPVETGFIGEGGRTIVLGQDAPVVDHVLISTGEQFVRVRNRSRTLTRISDDDR
jgi:hypothetical protein